MIHDLNYNAGLSSLIKYVLSEVSHDYHLEEDKQMYSDKQRRVSTFMKTPRELEKVSDIVAKYSCVLAY